jgi:peroxiredoxin
MVSVLRQRPCWPARWILLAALLTSTGEAFQQTPIEGVTGEPVLLTSGEGGTLAGLPEDQYSQTLVGYPENQYLKQVAPFVGKDIKGLLLMKKKPGGLSNHARFGLGFSLEHEIRGVGWILDGNEKDGYVLYLDLNVNGDLTDDPPIRFERRDGAYTRTFGARRDGSSPGLMKLTIVQQTGPEESTPAPCLRVERLTLRRGSIRVGDREIAFGLIGAPGSFGAVVFDLNGDGKLDLSRSSAEYYRSAERFVRLGDTDYEFLIDRNGDKLQLKPLSEKLPETQLLRPGYMPPDFTFQDLEGKTHRLSEYRGKVVLLDFWMISCDWCQVGIPTMVDAYRRLHGIGLEIIGINGEDAESPLRSFLAEKNITWPQTIQDKDDGPIHKLYRVGSFPAYYLIARDGKLASRRLEGGSEDEILAWAERLAAAPQEAPPGR